jgi:hypothetical protein
MILLMSSCSDYYYQIYKVQSNDVKIHDNNMIYEDSICKIVYNLWNNGGNPGFRFENKTGENIYINLSECFFIKNKTAYDYFLNRTYNKGISNSLSTTYINNLFTNSIGHPNIDKKSIAQSLSLSYKEKDIICIPAHSSKVISEYFISKDLYRDCEYLLHPTKKQEKTLSFTESNSPIIFSNSISLNVGENKKRQCIINHFYISEIKNISSKNEFKETNVSDCLKKNIVEKHMKDYSPDKFYISYRRSLDKY